MLYVSRSADAANYFTKTGLVTGDNNPSVGSGSSCTYQICTPVHRPTPPTSNPHPPLPPLGFPYQLKMCDHHEGGPYPACPSICSPGECATPACPADSGAGKCSEAGYKTAWAADKKKAKKPYTVSGVTAIMTDIVNNGKLCATNTPRTPPSPRH